MIKSAALSAFSYEFSLLYVLELCAGCMPNKSGPNASEIQECTRKSIVLETNVHLVHALMTKMAGIAQSV